MGFFNGRVTPADYDNFLIAEEETVTDRTVGHATASQFFFTRHTKMAVERTGRHNDCLSFINLRASMHSLKVTCYFNMAHIAVVVDCVKTHGPLVHVLGQFWAGNQGKTRIVFHVCRVVDFPARNAFFNHVGLEIGS